MAEGSGATTVKMQVDYRCEKHLDKQNNYQELKYLNLSCLSSTCDEKLLVGGGSGAAQRLREADEVRPVRHLLHRQGAGHHRPALLLRRGLHPAGQDPGSREAGYGQDYR